MMNKYFYDTCSLLKNANALLENDIIISSITLKELENIKTSYNKDAETKFLARRVLHLLEENPDKYEICIYKPSMEEIITNLSLEVTNDTKILACAKYYFSSHRDMIFVTNDLALKHIAELFFDKDNIQSIKFEANEYDGFKEVVPTEEQLSLFYQDSRFNIFDCAVNEYLIMKSPEGEITDIRCWTGEDYRFLRYKDFTSRQFGQIMPFKNDIYQKILFDSLSNNEMTLIGGPPGSGKTYIALGYLFDRLERGVIDRIVIFCNPVAARGACKLGYYPGTRTEKLLSSQIGTILQSKLGGMQAVENLIDNEQLILVPAADARGYEVPQRSGVYIIEAQNLDIILLKMLIQRVGEQCKLIIDGDNSRQIDLDLYAGDNNGIKRLSEVFKGQNYFGQINLQNVYRSKIAELAEAM